MKFTITYQLSHSTFNMLYAPLHPAGAVIAVCPRDMDSEMDTESSGGLSDEDLGAAGAARRRRCRPPSGSGPAARCGKAPGRPCLWRARCGASPATGRAPLPQSDLLCKI